MKLKVSILFLLMTIAFPAKSSDREWLLDSMPAQWHMTPQRTQTLPDDDAWWRRFNDPVLDTLISKAVANNYNVASALKRIEIARKQIGEARAGYFPTINLSGGWTRQQSAGAMQKEVVPSATSSYFSLGADMNWEIDVFGRVREGVKAKKASYNASRADYDAVIVSLCANVADAYARLRMNQKQLEVATMHIESQQHLEEMAVARFEAELSSMLDVTQARIVLYNTKSSIPALKAGIKTLINTISILIGEYPGEIAHMLETHMPFPDYQQTVEAGVPSDLLRRRPDIMQAEQTLGEYAAMVGVSKKDFLPTLSLTGSIGTYAHRAGDLFGSHSLGYSIAPQLSWTLFDGMARNYRTAEAKLQLEAAVDAYNLTVMNAVEEVDNALIDYDSTLESIQLQHLVVEQSENLSGSRSTFTRPDLPTSLMWLTHR